MLLKLTNGTGKNVTRIILQQKRCFPFLPVSHRGSVGPSRKLLFTAIALFVGAISVNKNE